MADTWAEQTFNRNLWSSCFAAGVHWQVCFLLIKGSVVIQGKNFITNRSLSERIHMHASTREVRQDFESRGEDR